MPAPRFGLLLAGIVGFLIVGAPLVALAWHNVNHLLAGDLRIGPLITAVGALGGLAGLMVVLGRVIARWDVVTREK
jgi:hypothetical protein